MIHGKGIKILPPKQMIPRLSIAISQVKAINTSENLLSEIGQVIYSFYQVNKITKKLYNNIINSIQSVQ